MPIYTRTGDKGKTSLFDGTRVLKSDMRVETYGTVDELNSAIGAAIAVLSIKHQVSSIDLKKELEEVQHDLFEIGSALATPHPLPVVGLGTRPRDFEKLIDKMTSKLPKLANFILPGGSVGGATIHVARAVSRRTERMLIALIQIEEVDQNIVIYLNRLSDLLFTMARYVNHTEKARETVWIKK